MVIDAAALLAEQNALAKALGPAAGQFFRYRCAALAARPQIEHPAHYTATTTRKQPPSTTASSASSLTAQQQAYESFDDIPIHAAPATAGRTQYAAVRSRKAVTNDDASTTSSKPSGAVVPVVDIASVPLKPPGHQEPNFASATVDAVSGIVAQAPAADVGSTRVECSVCGRLFAQDRIAKHQKACAKANQTERKAFDVRQVRVQNVLAANMAENDVQRVLAGDADPEVERKMQQLKAKKASWRQQSAALQGAMRSARGDGAQFATLVEEDLRVLCSGCGRKFSPDTAETHIPRCIERARGR